MAVVDIDLLPYYDKPLISLETPSGNHITVLIDTGAHMPVWNDTVDFLKLNYKDAVPTNDIVYIGGFGGSGLKVCEVWKIPEIILHDRAGRGNFKIHNFLVAILDSEQHYFDLIFSSTVFNNINYSFRNAEMPKYMQIEYNRDIYCMKENFVPHENELARLKEVDNVKINNGLVQVNGKTVISKIRTFVQDL